MINNDVTITDFDLYIKHITSCNHLSSTVQFKFLD